MIATGHGSPLPAAPRAVASARKTVTVVFADVADSTGLGEQLGHRLAEARRGLLGPHDDLADGPADLRGQAADLLQASLDALERPPGPQAHGPCARRPPGLQVDQDHLLLLPHLAEVQLDDAAGVAPADGAGQCLRSVDVAVGGVGDGGKPLDVGGVGVRDVERAFALSQV